MDVKKILAIIIILLVCFTAGCSEIPEEVKEIDSETEIIEEEIMDEIFDFNAIKFTDKNVLPERGAYIPWKRIEAENGETNGKILSGVKFGLVSCEASERSYVELKNTNEFVEVVSPMDCDRIIVRYGLEKGEDGTLCLYVNGELSQVLELSSFHTGWTEMDRQGRNEPMSRMMRCFEDLIITQNVASGDVIKLQKNADNTASVYRIDFIEFEKRPDMEEMPNDGNWVSILEYGVANDGITDVTADFDTAVYRANKSGKNLWLDEGEYLISETIEIPDGMDIAGAGMWYSVIIKDSEAEANGMKALRLGGNNVCKDLKITEKNGNMRINGNEGIIFSNNCIIDSVWVENTFGAGIITHGGKNNQILNCRVRGTYADSIHIAQISSNNVIRNNTIRNSGDDGIAFIAYDSVGMENNIAINNTVEVSPYARGMTIAGGNGNQLLNNVILDTAHCSGILVTVENYANRKTQYCTDFVVRNNDLIRTGMTNNGAYGGLWVWGYVETPLEGVIEGNRIIDPVMHVMTFTGVNTQEDVIVQNNILGKPGSGGQLYVKWDNANPSIGENEVLKD